MAVIKHGNILQYILLSCMTDLVVSPVDSFLFKAAEEAFCYSIIKTITDAAHTAHKTMYFQKPPVFSLLAYCDPRSECTINPVSYLHVGLPHQASSFPATNRIAQRIERFCGCIAMTAAICYVSNHFKYFLAI